MKHLFISTLILSLVVTLFNTASAQQTGYLYLPSGGNFALYRRGGSTFIINQSKLTQWKIYDSMRKLASGKRVGRASDDPAAMAVTEGMDSIIKEMTQRAVNDEDLQNYVRFTEGALAQNQALIKRIHLLCVKASNGIYGELERDIIQTEIDILLDAIDSNALYSTFNKKQVIPTVDRKFLGLQGLSVVESPHTALQQVNNADELIVRLRTSQGASENLLSYRIKGKLYHVYNIQAAQSRLIDLNMAEEISNLISQKALLQTQHGTLFKSK
jgi:flagellin